MTTIQGKQLQIKLEAIDGKLIGELQINEGPIPVKNGPIADKIFLREYNNGDKYILSLKIEWNDGVIYESIYDEGVGEGAVTLEDVRTMILTSYGSTAKQINKNTIRLVTPPSLEEIVDDCYLFRKMGF